MELLFFIIFGGLFLFFIVYGVRIYIKDMENFNELKDMQPLDEDHLFSERPFWDIHE